MSKYNVIKFQAPYERLKDYDNSAEVNLYKAVIIQVITDLSNNSADKRAKKLEIEAKNWVFGDNNNFKEICNYALLRPSEVRKWAKDAMKAMGKEEGDDKEILFADKINPS